MPKPDYLLPMKQPAPTTHPDSHPVEPFIEIWLSARSEDRTRDLRQRLEERQEFGRGKYGQDLHSHDGRDHILDLEQEILDAIQYACALGIERDDTLGWDVMDILASAWDVLQRGKRDGKASQAPTGG